MTRALLGVLFIACAHVEPLPKLDDRALGWNFTREPSRVESEPYVATYKTHFEGSPNVFKKLLPKVLLGSSGINLLGPGASTSSPTYTQITLNNGVNSVTATPNGGSWYIGAASFWSNSDNGLYVDTAGTKHFYFDSATGYMAVNGVFSIHQTAPILVAGIATGKFQITSNISAANANATTAPMLEIIPQSALDATDLVLAIRSSTAADLLTVTHGGIVSLGTGGVLKFVALADSATAPTISSGFGASPSVATNNGTAAFTINVGTGGVATSGVIGLPTAANGWVCQCNDIAAAVSTSETKMSATSTTSCTVSNVNTATGVAVAWAASEILHCMARGR